MICATTFVAAWGERPITDITEVDVLAIVNAKKRRAPEQARALLILIKRFFDWAIDQRSYGLTASPCDRLQAIKIIGESNRAPDTSPTPRYSRSGERPGGWAIRSVRSIARCC